MSTKKKSVVGFDKGFWLEFNRFRISNFKIKTLDIVEHAKDYNQTCFSVIKNVYNNAISQAIGSMLSTLIYKAAKQPNDYIANRYSYLKEVAEMVKNESAYGDLFEFVKMHHGMSVDGLIYIEFQVINEMQELLEMITPFNMELIGLNGGKPIFATSKFPYTKKFIGLVNHIPDRKNKRFENIYLQNYARNNLKSFFSRMYGFYNYHNIDLVPQNSVNLIHFQKTLKLPRKILSTETYVDIIRNNKKYVINKNGVVVDCYNAGNIETILLIENNEHLLFKVILSQKGWVVDNNGNLTEDINGGEYTGFIDLRIFNLENEIDDFNHYSYLVMMTEYMDNCFDIINFIMECYTDLTCGLDYLPSKRKIHAEDQILFDISLSDKEIETHFVNKDAIGVRYTPLSLYKEGKKITSRTSKVTREKYFVSGHIRKLPGGHTISPEAKRNAIEYGINISEGYTFVTPHYAGLEKVRSYYKKIVD